MKNKIQKEVENRRKIADGIMMIRQARVFADELSRKYDRWVDEAAMLGEDEYSNSLIAEQVELEDFSRSLSFLEIRIMESATTTDVFNNLNKLPIAIDACKSLLKQGVDMTKLGTDMAEFKKSLDKARTQIKDLRSELSNANNPIYAELFGKKVAEDPKITAKIAAKKQARELRLGKLADEGAVYASPVVTDNDIKAEAEHGIDDITAMIDEENNKE